MLEFVALVIGCFALLMMYDAHKSYLKEFKEFKESKKDVKVSKDKSE